MGLSFALPAALGLLSLLGVVLWAHWMRRPPSARRAFGAMLIARKVSEKIRRRRKFQDVSVMILRLLTLLALVLSAAGMTISWQGRRLSPSSAGPVVIALDRSLSMGQPVGESTAMSEVKARLSTALAELAPGRAVSLVVYDEGRAVRAEAAQAGTVSRMIDMVEPGFSSDRLAPALDQARALLGGMGGEVWLASDLSGQWRTPAVDTALLRILDEGGAVLHVGPEGPRAANAAVEAVSARDGLEGGRLEIEVGWYGEPPGEVRCEAALPGGALVRSFVDLPRAGRQLHAMTLPLGLRGGPIQVRCEDGALGGDNGRALYWRGQGAGRLRLLDGAPGATPLSAETYFLQRALADFDVISALPSEVRGGALVLANVADPVAAAPALLAFVEEGGSLLIAGGDNVAVQRYNHTLSALLPGRLRVVDFADPRERGAAVLSEGDGVGGAPMRAWRALGVEGLREGAQVRLRYDNGHPALIEQRVGKGRVFLWTTTLDLGWGTAPLSPQFPALFRGLAQELAGDGGDRAFATALVGTLQRDEVGAQVVDPRGEVRLDLDPQGWAPDAPGLWEVRAPGGARLLSATTDPRESELRVSAELEETARALAPARYTRKLAWAPWGVALAWVGVALAALAAALGRRGDSEGGSR